MPRIMFSSTGSNSGKTTVVCAVLKSLQNRNLDIKAFKCGPDYIDGMYHRFMGIESGNLDSYFCNRDELCTLLDCGKFSVIEGAMGFYDGLSFTEKASAYEISNITNTPVVLVINARGVANSISAILSGFKNYRQNNIVGVIFNQISPMVYKKMSDICINLGLRPLGYMPYNSDFSFESRHLGLKCPEDISQKLYKLALQAEQTLDLDAIVDIANNAENLNYNKIDINKAFNKTVAVARDEAFSFLYEDNINLLKLYGCDIKYFSPLRDKKLPDCDRLIITGGYPELYGRELSQNKELMCDIKCKIQNGLKTIAECGGFMYLHNSIECADGNYYDMTGVIDAKCYKSDRLKNFGYFNMQAQCDNLLCKKGETMTVHEFHYWQSTNCGEDFVLDKMGKTHLSGIASDTLYAGFPHIYFWGNRNITERFLVD